MPEAAPSVKLYLWHELTPERLQKLTAAKKEHYIDFTGKDDPTNAYMQAGIPPEQAERLRERSKTGQALITRAPRESGGGTMNTDSLRLPPEVPKTNFSSKAGNVTVKSTKVGPAKNMFRANVAQKTLDPNDVSRMHAFLYRQCLDQKTDNTENMQKMGVGKDDVLHSILTGEDFKKFISKESTIEKLPEKLQDSIKEMKAEKDPAKQKELFKALEKNETLNEIVTNKSHELHQSFFSDVLQYKRIPVMQCENRVEDIMRNIAAGFYIIDKVEDGKLTFSTPEESGFQYQIDLKTLKENTETPIHAMPEDHKKLYSDSEGPLGIHAATLMPYLEKTYYSNIPLEVKEDNQEFKPLMVAADEVVRYDEKGNEVIDTCAMKGDIDRFTAGMPKTPIIEGSNTPVNTFLDHKNIDSLLKNTRGIFDRLYEIHLSEDKSQYDPEHVKLAEQHMGEITKALEKLPDNQKDTNDLEKNKEIVWTYMLGKADLVGLTSLAGAASPHEFFTGVLDNFCSSCDPANNFNTHYNHGMELRNPKKPSNLNAAYVVFLDGKNHYCPDEKSLTQTLSTAINTPGEPTFFEKTHLELDPRWAFTTYDAAYAGTPEQKNEATFYTDKAETVKNWQNIFSSKIKFHAAEIQKAQNEIPPNTAHIAVHRDHLTTMKSKMEEQIQSYQTKYEGIDEKIKVSDEKITFITTHPQTQPSQPQQIDRALLIEHSELLNQQRERDRLNQDMTEWNNLLTSINDTLNPSAPTVSLTTISPADMAGLGAAARGATPTPSPTVQASATTQPSVSSQSLPPPAFPSPRSPTTTPHATHNETTHNETTHNETTPNATAPNATARPQTPGRP